MSAEMESIFSVYIRNMYFSVDFKHVVKCESVVSITVDYCMHTTIQKIRVGKILFDSFIQARMH